MSGSPVAAARERDASLDILKSLLVTGMICAHGLQLAARSMSAMGEAISTAVNLITFSGFVFAYGFGTGLSGSDGPRHRPRALRRIGAIYLAYCISSLCFLVLVERAPVTPVVLLQIVFMARLRGYSEFLASFVLLALLANFLRPQLHWLIADRRRILYALIASLIASFVTFRSEAVPFLAAALGNRAFPNFPVLPYFVWFLAGMHCARAGRPTPRIVALFLLGTLAFLVWSLVETHLPRRFPPSFLWVVGSGLPLLLYWLAARRLAQSGPSAAVLALPGRYALTCLLASNLVFFAILRAGRLPLDTGQALALGLALTAAIVAIRHSLGRRPSS